MYLHILTISSLCLAFAGVHCLLVTKHVVTGQTVTFKCTLTESRPPGDISWVIQWHDGEEFKCDARKNSAKLSLQSKTSRGDYTTTYQSSAGILSITHVCSLTITNIDSNDNGYFSCVHDGWVKNHGRFFMGSLSVITPPTGSPKCSVLPIGTAIISGSVVKFQCSLNVSNLNTNLTWLRNSNETIGSTTSDTITVDYTLRPVDNGVHFVCKSSEQDRECRVTPLEQIPNATITPFTLQTSIGNNGTFTCCGEGLPQISHYEWYVNGSLLRDDGYEERFLVSSTPGCNELHIFNIKDRDNFTEVICAVSVQGGLSASAIATIVVSITDPADNILQHKGGSHSNLLLMSTSQIIAVVAVAFVIGITAIVVVAVIAYRRHKYRQLGDTTLASTEHDYQLNVLPEQKSVNERTTPTNAVICSSSINLPDRQVNLTTTDRSVDGLTYASLDLNVPVDDNEILHPCAGEAVMYADIRKM